MSEEKITKMGDEIRDRKGIVTVVEWDGIGIAIFTGVCHTGHRHYPCIEHFRAPQRRKGIAGQ
jgi:hypothetical protein